MKTTNISLWIGLLSLLLLNACKTKEVEINSNERGVLFKRFDGGVDTSKVYTPGKYTISDHDRMIVYNIDSRVEVEDFIITSKDEIPMRIRIEHKFKPIPSKIPLLHSKIGEGYYEYVVLREVEPIVNDYFKNILSNDIQLFKEKKFENEIFLNAKKSIAEKYINLEALKINSVNLLKE